MEISSTLWTTLTVLWAVDAFGIEPLDYLGHFPPHPLVDNIRHVREVEKSINERTKRIHRNRDSFLPHKHCCGGDNNTLRSHDNEIKGLFKKCVEEKLEATKDDWSTYGNPTKDPFSCHHMKLFKNHFYCISDCVMRSYGALGDDGTVNIDKWIKFTDSELAFPWLRDLAAIAVERCTSNEDYTWLKNEGDLDCNPRAVDFNHCVWTQIVMICPDEHFVKSDYCIRVKETFEEVDG